MLIDDQRVDQMIYRRIIERTGLVREVIVQTYADEALEFLKTSDRPKIDLIFLDINMPRMDGFEFLEAAAEELDPGFANAVIVMLTTSIAPADRARAESFDVVRDFIVKPLTEELVRDIATKLPSWRTH